SGRGAGSTGGAVGTRVGLGAATCGASRGAGTLTHASTRSSRSCRRRVRSSSWERRSSTVVLISTSCALLSSLTCYIPYLRYESRANPPDRAHSRASCPRRRGLALRADRGSGSRSQARAGALTSAARGALQHDAVGDRTARERWPPA